MATQRLTIRSSGAGLIDITERVAALLEDAPDDGLCTLFVRHTSASLLIQENADPSVLRDLQAFFRRLVPPGDPLFTHIAEGPDDMPSHIRSALTATSLSIPIVDGRLVLGTWQGIYLWEHRDEPHQREVLVHVGP